MSQRPSLPFGGLPNNTSAPPTQAPPPPPPPHMPALGTPSATAPHQQMAFQQNASLPSADVAAALHNISPQQLAAIAQLFQAGALPLPPPHPTTTQLQHVATTTPTIEPPVIEQLSAPLPQVPSAANADGGTDMEEGELEDGEGRDSRATRDFLRTPPKGPRKRSRSPGPGLATGHARGSASSQDPRPDLHKPVVTTSKPRSRRASPLVTGKSSTQQYGKHGTIRAFITEMHKAGYGFDQISKEVGNTHALRQLYEKLGVPLASPVATIPSDHVSSSTEELRKPSLPKKPAPVKPAAPQDRTAYLARLKAVTNKKVEPSAAPTKPTKPPTQEPPAAPTPHEALPAQQARRNGQVSDEQREAMNKLIKERLAAMTASRKADSKSSSDSSVASGPKLELSLRAPPGTAPSMIDSLSAAAGVPSDTGVPQAPAGTGIVPSSAQAQHESESNLVNKVHSQASPAPAVSTSASPTINRGFGLPGLFTTATSNLLAAQQSPGLQAFSSPPPATASPRPQSTTGQASSRINYSAEPTGLLGRKRKAESADTSGAREAKRTFGQYKTDEPFVIVDSDDAESDEDVRTANGRQGEPASSSGQHEARSAKSSQDMPSKFISLGASGVSTPRTPAAISDDYRKQQLAIEQTKRRLADLEARAAKKKNTAKPSERTTASESSPAAQDSVRDNSASEASTPVKAPGMSSFRSKQVSAKEFQSLQKRLRDLEAEKARHQMLPPVDSHNQVSASNYANEPAQGLNGNGDGVESSEDADFYDPEPHDTHTTTAESNGVSPRQSGSQATAVNSADTNALAVAGVPISGNASPSTAIHGSRPHVSEVHGTTAGVPSTSSGKDELKPQDIDSTTHSGTQIQSGQLGFDDGQQEMVDDDDLEDLYAPASPALHKPIPAASQHTEPPATASRAESSIGNETDSKPGDHDSGDQSEDAMDTSDASPSSSDDSADADLEVEPQAISQHTTVAVPDRLAQSNDAEGLAHTEQMPGDELAAELQPSAKEPVVTSGECSQPKSSFAPYESPLFRFKDYRYHPQFLDTIPGGFKSMTYSHKIDPLKPICPFETAGGRCNDKSCPYQHFKAMNLTDNELLKLMGTDHTPTRSPDEEKQWKSGLSAVVQELRGSNRGKDVSAIAQRIADYRREFLGDPTKTLLLD